MKTINRIIVLSILFIFITVFFINSVFSQSTPKIIPIPYYSQETGPNCWAAATLNLIRSVNPSCDDNIYRLVYKVRDLDGITMETLNTNQLYIDTIKNLSTTNPVIKTFTNADNINIIENYIKQEIVNNRPVAFCSSNPMASSETDSGHCITIYGYDNNNFYFSDPKARGYGDMTVKDSSKYFLYDTKRKNPRGTPTYNLVSLPNSLNSNRLLVTQLFKNKAFYISKTKKSASGFDHVEYVTSADHINGYYLRDFVTNKVLSSIPKGYNVLTIDPKQFFFANTYNNSVILETSIQAIDPVGNKKSKIVRFDTPEIQSNTFKLAQGEKCYIDLNQFRDESKKVFLKLNFNTVNKKTRTNYAKETIELILDPGKDDLIELDYKLEDNLGIFTIKKDTLPTTSYYCTWTITRKTPVLRFNQEIKDDNIHKFRFLTEGTYDIYVKVELDTKQDFNRAFYAENEIKNLYIPKFLDFNIEKEKDTWIIKPSLNFDHLPSNTGYIFTVSEGNNILYISDTKAKDDLKYTFKKAGKYTILLTLYNESVQPKEKIAEREKTVDITLDNISTTSKPEDTNTAAIDKDTVKLIIPQKLLGTDFVTAKVKLSPDLEKKTKQIYWALPGYLYSDGKEIDNKNNKREVQFQVVNNGYTNKSQAFVRLYDETDQEIFVSDPVDLEISQVGIGISSSSVWEVGTDGRSAGGKRKSAILKRMKDGNLRDSASIGGNLSIRWVDMLNIYDDAKLKAEYEPLVASGQYKEMRALNIQGFQGYLLINPVKSKYSGNQYGYVDLAHPEAQASVRGYIFKGKEAIKIEGSVFGGGTRLGMSPNFAYDDMPFVLSQTNTAFNELLGIIDSIKIELQPKSEKFPYNGPALDGSDLPVVKLKADKTNLKKGDIVTVNAIVENYSGNIDNLKYVWSGDHEGNGKDINFIANAPGKYTLSVIVENSSGNIGTASIEFNVEDIELTINKISPSTDSLIYGSEASFSASLTSDGKTIQDNNFVFHWEASDNLTFEPQNSSSNETKVRVNFPGTVKIWVNVLKKQGEGASTVATSPQINLSVLKPEFSITLDKPEPSIGEEIKASVKPKTNITDVSYSWEELPENAKLINESQDSNEISFILLDSNPVTIKVTAKTPHYSKELGGAETTLNAKGYDVTVSIDGPKYPAVKPMIWKQGIGLTEVESDFYVNQDINISASIKDNKNTDIIFNWETGSGCNISGSDTGNIVTVNRSEVGSCEVSAIAKDSRGNILGKGSNTLNVSISQADIDNASKIHNQVVTLTKQAQNKVNNGDLSGAINDTRQASELNPKDPDVVSLLNNLNQQNHNLNNLVNKANNQISSSDINNAKNTINEIKSIDKNNPAIKQLTDSIIKKEDQSNRNIEEKIIEIDGLIRNDKEFDLALSKASELRNNNTLNQHYSDWLGKEETWAKQQIQNKDKSKRLLTIGESKFNNKDFVGADVDMSNGLDTYDVWNKRDSEPQYFGSLRNQARENIKILNSISSKVFQMLIYQGLDPAVIDNAINDGKYAITLSPVFEPRMPDWIKTLEAKKQALLKLLADKQNSNTQHSNLSTSTANKSQIPSQPVQAPIKHIDNFNGGGCSYTDNAKIRLDIPFDVTNLQIWYLWDTNEQSVSYKIIKDSRIITTGSFIKGACDPYQTQWCGGDTNTKISLSPGIYDIKLDRAKLCQNSTSSNNGFIRVFGFKSQAIQQPVTTNQNTSTTRQTYVAPKNVPSQTLTNKMLNITFTNQSGENIHFYGMGGKCSPDNIISPGGSTNTGVVTQYKILEYYVGRNGQTIGTVKIPVENLKNGQIVKLVFSNGILKIVEPVLQSGNINSNNSSVQGYQTQAFSNGHPVSILGKWNVVACGFPAIIEINGSASNMTGRINYTVLNTWEPIENIQYNSSTGQVSFKRTKYPQVHTGIVTGNKMEGNLIRYEVSGTPTCKWTASR